MTDLENHDEWDVFISYAREDFKKARDLADGLQKCITSRGVPPRIFIDVDPDGFPPGVNWKQYLEEALPRSRYFVALYTLQYFSKNHCLFELQRAVDLKEAGKVQFVPVLMEEAAKDKIWFTANMYNWVPVTHPGWFETVRTALGLRPARGRRQLRFDTSVPGAVVNHTLPTIRVSVTGADGTVQESGEPVTLTTVPPDVGLTGTLVIPTVRGTATFPDLSFHAAIESVRLLAQAPGCEPVETEPIQVTAPAPQPASRAYPRVSASGRPAFFPDGRHLAVFDGETLSCHAFDEPGLVPATAKLATRPRLWARGASHLAVADWNGHVLVATPGGDIRTADLGRTPGLAVPGALAFDGDTLLVGMWNGGIWSLADAEPQPVLAHHAGVQLLAVDDGGRLLVGDLGGVLTVYEDGKPRTEHQLERLLLGIHRGPGFTLIAGEHHVYRLDEGAARPLVVDLPVRQLADALVGTGLSVVLDDQGIGVCFDAELGVHLGFRTVPGARAVCAARDGRSVVFEYPNGSHVLMQDGRIGVTSAHPLAISPDGRLVATSDGSGTTVLPVEQLRTDLVEETA